MAVTAMTIRAERWLDEVLLHGRVDNVLGAAASEYFTLPAGLGDVAIMSMIVRGFTIATIQPSVITLQYGATAKVFAPDGATQRDLIGVAPLFIIYDAAAAGEIEAFIDPDALALCRQDERIGIEVGELDTDATPTGDLEILVKCVRVRPVQVAALPMQLTR